MCVVISAESVSLRFSTTIYRRNATAYLEESFFGQELCKKNLKTCGKLVAKIVSDV